MISSYVKMSLLKLSLLLEIVAAAQSSEVDQEREKRAASLLPQRKTMGKIADAMKDSGDALSTSGDILALHKDNRIKVAGLSAKASGTALRSSGDALFAYAGEVKPAEKTTK